MSTTLSNPIVPRAATTVLSSATSAPTKRSKVFAGFSSVDTDRTGTSKLYDIALIDRDLLNAFYTRRGERVMRPDWGCRIWEWLMDPLTPLLHDQIVAEVVRICQSDSRLSVLDTKVYEYENGLRVEMTLNYQPFNVINSFAVTFDNRQSAYFNNDANGVN
jgi:phage baseplate assembly protein W